MSTDLARPELERRPHLALAAKLLVALGVAIVFLLLRGQGADAVGGPAGPLEQVERATGVPVREVVHETTETVREVAAPVVEISAPRDPGRARPARAVERTVRVLPQADGTEAIRLDLHLDDEQLDVTVTPPAPGRVRPIRLQLPSLLDGLPSIDVAVVDGAVGHGRSPGLDRPGARRPGGRRSRPDTVAPAAPAERAARPAPSAPAPAERAPRLPVPDGSAEPAPHRRRVGGGDDPRRPRRARPPSRSRSPLSIVHAAQRRVPVAPAIRPSFTPD